MDLHGLHARDTSNLSFFERHFSRSLTLGQVFLFPPPCLNKSAMGSPIPNRYTQTLDFPSPIRIIQTHKQITFQNKNIASHRLNPVSSIDRDTCRALMNFNISAFFEEVSRPIDCTFLDQFLGNLRVFNVTTCSDHLERTQIYPNTVHFVKRYANYIKTCPLHIVYAS